MTLPHAVTLFSGGGVMNYGIRDHVEFVGAVEMDESVAAHYSTVYGSAGLHCADVCTVDYRGWAGVRWLHASPSCVNASVANSGRGETETDRACGAAIERAIVEIDPLLFTLENVQQYGAFDAFAGVCGCLAERGYVYDVQTINSADAGVPQTRRRLILRAWKRTRGLLPMVVPTHADRAKLASGKRSTSLFDAAPLLPWVGWYEALTHPRYGADLIPTLPKSKLAAWQIARLSPDILESLLSRPCRYGPEEWGDPWKPADEPAPTVLTKNDPQRAILVDGQGTMDDAGTPTCRRAEEPMQTVTASHWKGLPRAVLIDGQNSRPEGTPTVLDRDDPCMTVSAAIGRRPANQPRAILVEGDAAGDRSPTVRQSADPSFTLKTGDSGGRVHRAVLVDGQNTTKQGPIARVGETPSGTVGASGKPGQYRAILDSADVRSMTPRALARFMMGVYGDSYPLPEGKGSSSLACRILGNGCCPEMMRALMVPLLEETR